MITVNITFPPKRLSVGVENPGEKYIDTAHKVLKAIAEHVNSYQELPQVEDVAWQIKNLLAKK